MFHIKTVLEKKNSYSFPTKTLLSDTFFISKGLFKQLVLSIFLMLYIISIIKLIKAMYIFWHRNSEMYKKVLSLKQAHF